MPHTLHLATHRLHRSTCPTKIIMLTSPKHACQHYIQQAVPLCKMQPQASERDCKAEARSKALQACELESTEHVQMPSLLQQTACVPYPGVSPTQERLPGYAGVMVLAQGGNAVDATVTTALCQGIMNPAASGLGGGHFMVIRAPNGTTEVIDAREPAPSAATETMFSGAHVKLGSATHVCSICCCCCVFRDACRHKHC